MLVFNSHGVWVLEGIEFWMMFKGARFWKVFIWFKVLDCCWVPGVLGM